MTREILAAAFLLATATSLASGTASAAIIRGYADLYATSMDARYDQYAAGFDPDDETHIRYRPCGEGVCAKTRFRFEYDTDLPPYRMRTSLELLKTHYRPFDPEEIYPGFPTFSVNGREYLPLEAETALDPREAVYEQLAPSAPADFPVPPGQIVRNEYALAQFAVGAPGPSLGVTFQASKALEWLDGLCAPEDDECREYNGQWFADIYSKEYPPEFSEPPYGSYFDIANVGGSFLVSVLGADYPGCYYGNPGCNDFYELGYVFDNSPANWIDGPPEARTWIVGVPEPASVSLMGLGLAGLGVAGGGLRRRSRPLTKRAQHGAIEPEPATVVRGPS